MTGYQPDESRTSSDPEDLPALEQTIFVEDATLRTGFTQIPNLILFSKRLSPGAKLAYATLLHYAWQDGSCFPGQERMAADLNVQRQAVNKYLAELSTAGVVSIKRRGQGKTNLYVLPRLEESVTDVRKTVHQDVRRSDVRKSVRPDVAKRRQQDVRENVHNVYPVDVDPGTTNRSPLAPQAGGTRKERRAQAQASAEAGKWYRGVHAVCPRCHSLPHTEECPER